MRWFTRPAFRISRLIHRFSQKFWSRHFATMVTCRRTSVTRRPFCLRWFKKLRLCTASLFLTKLSIVVLHKTRLGHAIFRQKIHSYIWVAIPVDWVMVLWCRRTGARVKGRMVTWLPKFHRWIGNQICSAMGLCSRARVELRQKYTAKRQDGRESGLSKAFFLQNCPSRNSKLKKKFSSWRIGALGLFWNATKRQSFWRIFWYILYSIVKKLD